MNAKTENTTDDVKFDVVRLNGSDRSLRCCGGPFGRGHHYHIDVGNYPIVAPQAPAVSPAEAAAFFRGLSPLTGPAVKWLADRDAAVAAANGHATQPVTTAPPAQADARLSRRDEFARAAMTGILASPTEDGAATIPRFMAEAAVACADALIAELDKTPPAPQPATADAMPHDVRQTLDKRFGGRFSVLAAEFAAELKNRHGALVAIPICVRSIHGMMAVASAAIAEADALIAELAKAEGGAA